jgi:homoserine O-acetyltransferase/O-succinyltransferase
LSASPAPAYWRPGDDPGGRRFARIAPDGLALEAGGLLPFVDVAYETWGELDVRAANAVLVLHALTLDSHAAGPAGAGQPSPGWWDALIGPGAPLDTERFFVVCPNVLGGCRGTTGPSSPSGDGAPYGSRFPVVTIRDQVEVEARLADELGVERWAAVVGGSMGGMRVLEWAVGRPGRVERAVVLAVGAAATADQIALCSLQARAIRADPDFRGGDYYGPDGGGGPHHGMALARGLGQVSYRSGVELQTRFGRAVQDGEDPLRGGRFAVESYLAHHGDKLVQRFDPNSYVVLSEAMNHHDVGRGRGGVAAALGRVQADVTVAGITTDRLYPIGLQHELADLLPGHPDLHVIESAVGHDGFLVESGAVGGVLKGALAGSPA